MMKKIILCLLILLNYVDIYTADKNKKYPEKKITVTKEYDENGNLIKIDSSYSYVHSDFSEKLKNLDSIFNIFNDSTFLNFSKDLTENLSPAFKFMESQMHQMKELMQKMDSLHQHFFKEFDFEESGKKKKNKKNGTEL